MFESARAGYQIRDDPELQEPGTQGYPMKIVTAAQMQALDRRTIQVAGIPGVTLMERAGAGVVTALEQTCGSPSGKTITIFCGKGNNGGDGFVIARLLKRKRSKVTVCLLASPRDLRGDAKTMYQRFVKSAGTAAVQSQPTGSRVRHLVSRSDFIVDALLGTGISSPVSDHYQMAIEIMNDFQRPIIAVDLPSGIHADSGMVLGQAVRADLTVSFGYPKIGAFLGSAIDYVGKLRIVDIGIPPEYIDTMKIQTELLTGDMIRQWIPARPRSSHKGTFGHLGIIAGSTGKSGAAALSAKAALRSGTGLVTIATPVSLNSIMETLTLEAMTVPMPQTAEGSLSQKAAKPLQAFAQERTAIAIGPGLSTHTETLELVRSLVAKFDRPMVIDADALNALAGHTSILKTCRKTPILTPHPGEMARLLGKGTAHEVNQDRLGIARQFAHDHQCVLVLKGAHTLIANPDGDITISPMGNPGMASAGMGDVLTGMIGGFLAQGLPPWEAAQAGVFLHGMAGDRGARQYGQIGLVASDVIDSIPGAFQHILGHSGS